MESRRPTERWKPGDELEAVRLETERELLEAAQVYAASPNVHMWRGAQGGTALAVDETSPRQPGQIVPVMITERINPFWYKAQRRDIDEEIGLRAWRPHEVDDTTYASQTGGAAPWSLLEFGDYEPSLTDPLFPPAWIEIPRDRCPMTVILTSEGGGGTPGSPYVYSAHIEWTDSAIAWPSGPIATGLQPRMSPVRGVGKVLVATLGLLDWDSNGAPRLLMCDEVVDAFTCSAVA